jgi:two-component system chemotaxis response regulator CheY
MIDLDNELAQDYLADCSEHMAAVESDLLAIKMSEARIDESRLGRIFRSIHSVWGGALFFELSRIHELALKMEEVLAQIRSDRTALTPEQIRILLLATDRLNQLFQQPEESNHADIAEIMAALDNLRAGSSSIAGRASATAFHRADRSTGPLRTLLAEDDLSCRLLLQTFLSRYGECDVAVNGKEAVDAFRIAMEQGHPYDMVCMDILMPEMSGREAVRRIRAMEETRGIQSTSGTKVIMTTTVEDVKEVILCFQELCDAYLMKPIDLTELTGQMKHYQLIQ